MVFVDPTVPNYQDLLSGMDSNVEVIMLDGGQDGIEQMANALSGRTGIDAIHVISHGEAGALQLGTGVLNADSMSTQYADDLAVIQQSLSEQADILVYGCEFAQGEAGQAAVDLLAELTGADVQASDGRGGTDSQAISIRVTNVNEAPTDLTLSAHRVAENATTGTVVGTITGSDPNSRDTKTYSLTDTAGGRFAINRNTGVITVADGTLLNYESAQNHNITVQVMDRGGLTYRETFGDQSHECE